MAAISIREHLGNSVIKYRGVLGTGRCALILLVFIITSGLVAPSAYAQAPILTGLSNDSIPKRSKTWSWGCSAENCSYIYIVDQSENTIPTGAASTATSITQASGDGTYYLHIIAKDAAGNASEAFHFSAILDNTAPTLTSLSINNGATYAGTALPLVFVTATDADSSSVQIRIKEANPTTGDCQSEYADDLWVAYPTLNVAQAIPTMVSGGDGTKKICGWTKDAAGNVSKISSPSTGSAGINMDTVELSIANLPRVVTFTATNNTAGPRFGTTTYASGEQVLISWTVTDVEGLDSTAPVSLSFTTNGSTYTSVTLPSAGLSGNPTSHSGSFTMTAPSANFFRFKLIANDLAGNSGRPVLSDAQNGRLWSVYAGSFDQGIGASALAANISGNWNASASKRPFAIDPRTNDMYVAHGSVGILRISAVTGKVSLFMANSTSNLPTSTTSVAIPSSLRGNPSFVQWLAFDSKGRLYFQYGGWSLAAGAVIYQLDLQNNTMRLYLGGGTVTDQTATPGTAWVYSGAPYALDEDNALYYITTCSAGVITNRSNVPLRLLKVTQNADGSAGAISVVAGNCTSGAPTTGTAGVNALTTPLAGNVGYPELGALTVWNRGKAIYYAFYSGSNPTYKILNGVTYLSNISGALSNNAGISYNPVTKKLYVANSRIDEYTPNTNGANGDLLNSGFVTSTGSGSCVTTEGIAANSACVTSQNSFAFGPDGTLFFTDGALYGMVGSFRIRYRDMQGRIRTAVGTPPLVGDREDKQFARGGIAGIYYKQASEPNQGAFPEGLYFMDNAAIVFGRISSSTNLLENLWGNQQKAPVSPLYTTGTPIGINYNLGAPYSGGSGYSLTFDQSGLPWLRYQTVLASIDANSKVIQLQNFSNSTSWENIPENATPRLYGMHVYGGITNLTLKSQSVFLTGSSSSGALAKIRNFDFATNKITTLMGNGVAANAVSADNSTPGAVRNLSLSNSCTASPFCASLYRASEDRLYFAEDSALRYITKPTDTSQSTLATLFTHTARITNFIFRPDGTQLFYLDSGAALRCFDLTSGKSYCNRSNLAPASGISSIAWGPNQMTWKDNNTLLISDYRGQVLQYVPDAPAATGLTDDATPTKSKTWSWGCAGTSCTYITTIDQSPTTIPTGPYSSSTTATQATGTGTYYLHIIAKDQYGNVSPPAHYSAVLDNTVPTLIGVANDENPTKSKTWSWGCNETCTYLFAVDQSPSTVPNGTFSSTTEATQPVGDGTYYLHIIVRDALGNRSEPLHYSAILDNTPPAVTGLSDDDTPTTAKTWNWGCTDIGCTYRYSVNQSPSSIPWGRYTSTTTASQLTASGKYYIHVTAKDLAGNISSTVHAYAILVTSPDSLLPAVTGLSNDFTPTQRKVWSWGCTSENCTFLYSIDKSPSTIPKGTFSTQRSAIQENGDGTYYIHVIARGPSGAQSNVVHYSAVLDNSPPAVSKFSLNNDSGYASSILSVANITATDAQLPIYLRLAEVKNPSGDCQSEFKDDSWLTYNTPGKAQDYPITLSNSYGTRKICLWTKDTVGNVSTISSPNGLPGIDSNSIVFDNLNIPVIASISASNSSPGINFGTTNYSSGEKVTIKWSVTDVEGLNSSQPILLSYTTNGSTFTNVPLPTASLAANTTTYSSSHTITTPTTGFFRFRIIARDSTGNLSVPLLSDAQNSGKWSVYAGTTDRGVGAGPLSAALWGFWYNSGKSPIAINPLTNDLYAIDHKSGIIKLDTRTGTISRFMGSGTLNLPSKGPIPTTPAGVVSYMMNIAFDNLGRLYLQYGPGNSSTSAKIYQFNFALNTVSEYLGGGSAIDNSATPSTAFVFSGSQFAFDEDNSLYYIASCHAGAMSRTTGNTQTFRLLKVTQNSDSSPGAVSVVAGNCTRGLPTTSPVGVTALNAPFTNSDYPDIGALAVWNRGATIYYGHNSNGLYKILNGITYTTSITPYPRGLAYNRFNGKLYVAKSNLQEWTANLSGANGDIQSTTPFVANNGSGACSTTEGIAASAACANVDNSPIVSANGLVLFVDGPSINGPRPYRIRYKDSEGGVRTLMGTLPFAESGLNRSSLRSSFAGIYYKQPTEPNQAAFPSGLYFMDNEGMVLGTINPTTGLVSKIGGNQSNLSITPYATGTAIEQNTGLGIIYSGGDGWPLMFDAEGLPWFRYQYSLASLDSNRRFIRRQLHTGPRWDTVAEESSPYSASLFPYGARQNLAIKGSSTFLLGGYDWPNSPIAKIRSLDFLTNKVTTLMGLNGVANGLSPDNSQPGAAQTLGLSPSCINTGPCYIAYNSKEDRVYFSEDTRLRYLTSPSDPKQSTLGTLFSYSGGVYNYTIRPDGSQVFFTSSSGTFRCHDISSGQSYCNKTTNLAPTSGLTGISNGANQFTWADNYTLFVSNYNGNIYKFEPDGPQPTVLGLAEELTVRKSKTWSWSCSDPAGCTYAYLIDQNPTSVPTGAYSSTKTATQATGDGKYYLHLIAKNSFGRPSDVYHVSATLDNTAPIVTGLSDDPTPAQRKTWSWGCSDSAGCDYLYTIDQSPLTTPTGAFTSNTSVTQSVGDGVFYLHIIVRDALGNASAVRHYAATIDNTPPTITGLSDDPLQAFSKSWNWGCNEEACSYQFVIDQAPDTTPSGEFGSITTAGLESGSGTYYIHVRAKDRVGNVSPTLHVSANLIIPPTATPTFTPTDTPTVTPTVTPTATSTATPTDTPTATSTPAWNISWRSNNDALSIFITSSTLKGDLGGLEAARVICQNEASAAGLSGSWFPILSASTWQARTMIGDALSSSAIYNIDGSVIATSRAGLWLVNGADIPNAIAFEATGRRSSATNVWSGTQQIADQKADTCDDWTNSDTGSGDTTSVNNATGLFSNSKAPCNTSLPVYCIGNYVAPGAISVPSDPVPTATPTYTPSATPTFTPTVTPTATPTPQSTDTPTSGQLATSTPTPTPTSIQTLADYSFAVRLTIKQTPIPAAPINFGFTRGVTDTNGYITVSSSNNQAVYVSSDLPAISFAPISDSAANLSARSPIAIDAARVIEPAANICEIVVGSEVRVFFPYTNASDSALSVSKDGNPLNRIISPRGEAVPPEIFAPGQVGNGFSVPLRYFETGAGYSGAWEFLGAQVALPAKLSLCKDSVPSGCAPAPISLLQQVVENPKSVIVELSAATLKIRKSGKWNPLSSNPRGPFYINGRSALTRINRLLAPFATNGLVCQSVPSNCRRYIVPKTQLLLAFNSIYSGRIPTALRPLTRSKQRNLSRYRKLLRSLPKAIVKCG